MHGYMNPSAPDSLTVRTPRLFCVPRVPPGFRAAAGFLQQRRQMESTRLAFFVLSKSRGLQPGSPGLFIALAFYFLKDRKSRLAFPFPCLARLRPAPPAPPRPARPHEGWVRPPPGARCRARAGRRGLCHPWRDCASAGGVTDGRPRPAPIKPARPARPPRPPRSARGPVPLPLRSPGFSRAVRTSHWARPSAAQALGEAGLIARSGTREGRVVTGGGDVCGHLSAAVPRPGRVSVCGEPQAPARLRVLRSPGARPGRAHWA